MAEAMHVFNRRAVRAHRERAAVSFGDHDFLFREVGERLLDRLDDIRRTFPVALDLGCRTGLLGELHAGRGGVETLLACDPSPAMASAASRRGGRAAAADEEALPFADGALDLVLSNLSLHWVNDLPGAMIQVCHALRPDGLFLASLFGGETLFELRTALYEAEMTVEGGMSPRVSPFADVRDVGNLLQRAGFALPVVDKETITVSYESPFRLMHDLRGMGETNAVAERRTAPLRRETLMTAMRIYQERFADADGRVPATFDIVFLSGWAPDASQPKPKRRGSAEVSLADALADEDGGN